MGYQCFLIFWCPIPTFDSFIVQIQFCNSILQFEYYKLKISKAHGCTNFISYQTLHLYSNPGDILLLTNVVSEWVIISKLVSLLRTWHFPDTIFPLFKPLLCFPKAHTAQWLFRVRPEQSQRKCIRWVDEDEYPPHLILQLVCGWGEQKRGRSKIKWKNKCLINPILIPVLFKFVF